MEDYEEVLEEIKEQYRIPDDRFSSGIRFILDVQDGVNRNSAYAKAFSCTREVARTKSSQLYRTKWIQAIIEATAVDDEIRDIQSREDIKAQMSSIMSGEEDNVATKDRIAAARVLLSATEKKKQDKTEESSTAKSTALEILNHIKQISDKGQIISQKGDVIDVKVIS